MANIKNRDKLFQDIADGLKALRPEAQIRNIRVIFEVYDGTLNCHNYQFVLVQAIDNLINDICYPGSRRVCSEAHSARVEEI